MKCLSGAEGEESELEFVSRSRKNPSYHRCFLGSSCVSRKRDYKINGFAYVELTQSNPKRKKKFESFWSCFLRLFFPFLKVNKKLFKNSPKQKEIRGLMNEWNEQPNENVWADSAKIHLRRLSPLFPAVCFLFSLAFRLLSLHNYFVFGSSIHHWPFFVR